MKKSKKATPQEFYLQWLSERIRVAQDLLNAARYVETRSCLDLLGWLGPMGLVFDIAFACRIALEDYVAEAGVIAYERSLEGMQGPAARLLQKKMRSVCKLSIVSGVVEGKAHTWCESGGVAIDLARTRFDINAPRVHVTPTHLYPCQRRDAGEQKPDEEIVKLIERFYVAPEVLKNRRRKCAEHPRAKIIKVPQGKGFNPEYHCSKCEEPV